MAALSPVDPAMPAPILAPREQRENANRAAAEFGAAVTHRDRIERKPRVDPAARAAHKRQIDPSGHDDDAPEQSVRDERLAADKEEYKERQRERPGSRVDIRV